MVDWKDYKITINMWLIMKFICIFISLPMLSYSFFLSLLILYTANQKKNVMHPRHTT